MKNILLKYSLLLMLAVFAAACMEEDEKFATLTEAPGSIIISIPESALPAPPVGQPQLTQPNLNLVSGRFSRTGNVVMTITLSEGFSDLTISTLVTATGVKGEKASFTGVNGSVDWSYPVNTLNVNNTAPATGSSVVLLLTATNSAGISVSRVFSVTVLA